MSKIYTRTGDKGKTSLLGGIRVEKYDLRVEVYGTCDELNSFLGLAIAKMNAVDLFAHAIVFLKTIQSDLFVLGALFACEKKKREEFALTGLTNLDVKKIEAQIDVIEKMLPAMKNFILPGRSELASTFHICRTICRRLERWIVKYSSEYEKELPEFSVEYCNRLSDFFFVMARYTDFILAQPEEIWFGGK